MPGLSFEYEEPTDPDLRLATDELSIEESVARIISLLKERGILT